MRLGDRIAVISMVVFSLVMASVATDQIPGNTIVLPREAAEMPRVNSAAQRPTSNDPTRDKTLAVLLLMLREGRGARP